MSQAIKSTVEKDLSLNDRTLLEELYDHQQRLIKQMQDRPRSRADTGPISGVLDEDLEVIRAAISRH